MHAYTTPMSAKFRCNAPFYLTKTIAILHSVCKILPLNSIFKSRALSAYQRRILFTDSAQSFKTKFYLIFYGEIPRHSSIIIKFCQKNSNRYKNLSADLNQILSYKLHAPQLLKFHCPNFIAFKFNRAPY